jgi:three-Cys-motif partner protein
MSKDTLKSFADAIGCPVLKSHLSMDLPVVVYIKMVNSVRQAVESAEAKINNFREKKMTVDAHYYFIEKMKNTFSTLSSVLSRRYKDKMGQTIFLKNGLFEEYVDTIINSVRKRNPRSRRVIFFLDQTGYSQVNPKTVRYIREQLKDKHGNEHAEFIITISTDYFTDFINDKLPTFKKKIQDLGLEPYINSEEILRIKKENQDNWKYIIEAKFSFAWQQATGASYIRPFFIEPEYTHRGYWLLHLSPHPTAHDAMTDIHWEKGNYFRHYGGGLGFNIFGYKPQPNDNLNGTSFNDVFRQENEKSLMEEIPRHIRKFGDDGIRVEEFIDMYRNFKAVSNIIVEKALLNACQEQQIVILGSQGGKKRNLNSLSKKDIILPQRQIILL